MLSWRRRMWGWRSLWHVHGVLLTVFSCVLCFLKLSPRIRYENGQGPDGAPLSMSTCELSSAPSEKKHFCGSFRARSSWSKVRLAMLRQFLQRLAIRQKDYAQRNFVRASSSSGVKTIFEVKINRQNETFELHDATSGKQKKFEFPFLYLRDNCQVSSATVNF